MSVAKSLGIFNLTWAAGNWTGNANVEKQQNQVFFIYGFFLLLFAVQIYILRALENI